MAYEQFPYSNFHDLNLDWILQRVSTIEEVAKDIDKAVADKTTQYLASLGLDSQLAQLQAKATEAENAAKAAEAAAPVAAQEAVNANIQTLTTQANTATTQAANAANSASAAQTAAQTAEQQVIENRLAAYPVGSVYISYSATNPGAVFPGTVWSSLPNKFLRVGTSAGIEGGANSHTMTANNLPPHAHSSRLQWASGVTSDQRLAAAGTTVVTSKAADTATYGIRVDGGDYTGTSVISSGGQTATNEPIPTEPEYVTVYAWRRTA